MNKTFIWLGIVVLVVIGFVFLGNSAPTLNPPLEESTVHPQDNIKGNASSTVIVIEYSDFQCPACRSYYPVMRELMTEYGDRVAFVFRHFPLTSIHLNAEFAGRAAEAAGKQGKFWEMHDILFEKQNEWASTANVVPLFESYAELASISKEQFKTDFNSTEVKNFVRAQRAHAVKIGLSGTPSFFVNGEQIRNPNSIEEFKSLINAALNETQ